MSRDEVVSRLANGRARWDMRPLLVVVLASLSIRCLQLLALKIASGSQAPSPPVVDKASLKQYYVFSPSSGSPGLGPILANWDGQWYMRIATIGYPRAEEVQSAADGWASAFPPGFPLLARATMGLTGLPFVWASLLVNTVLALFAAVLLYQLLRWRGLSALVAGAAGIGLSLLPASPVLVTAYSEAIAMALVVLALRLLLSHRYIWMSLALIALSVTRPVALAFTPVVLVHAALRWRSDRDVVQAGNWGGMAVALIAAAMSPWLWPWIAAHAYGVPDSTQFIGSERTSKVVAGLGSGYLSNAFQGSGIGGLVLVLAVALLLMGVPTLLALRIGWPLELIAWGVAYTAMLIIVTPPSPALLRYLVLAAPLYVVLFAALVARPKAVKTVLLVLLVALCFWTQWAWIQDLFILDTHPFFGP